MATSRFTLCLAFSTVLALSDAPAQRPLWGHLERGPHNVGFRQLWLRDITRAELASPSAAGGSRPGRQMHVSLWYPATTGGLRMTYGDYINTAAQTLVAGPLTQQGRRAASVAFISRAAGFRGDTATLRVRLDSIAVTAVFARRGAAPARGRHPLVLYPESPGANSIIAEYLASHGFVVASAPIFGANDTDFEYFAVSGIETLVADLAFVHAALDSLPFIDTRNVAAMGLGFGATGALAFQMRSPAIRAVVSLEGGITTEGEQRLLLRWPLYDVGAARVPLLAITAPHPSVDPTRLQLYRYAPQTLVHFAGMGEFWFQDYGKLEALSPRIIGRAPGDVATGFEWGARWVRAFLAAHLRGDSAAARWLAAPADAPSGVFAHVLRPAAPAPPTLVELKRLIDRDGLSALGDLVASRAPRDSQPFPAEYFVALNAWLGEGRDGAGDKRRALADVRVRLYPRSTRAHAALAASALRMADSTAARQHYAESLRLMADDPDPLLDLQTRRGIERSARALGAAS